MKNKLFLQVATLGQIGYLPAPGTCGTLATLPFVFLLQHIVGSGIAYALVVLFFLFISFFVVNRALAILKQGNDPQQIILDEVVGCMILFAWMPLSCNTIVFGVLLFRIFDIFKPGPIGWLEKLPGAWGNISDDVLAALVSNLIMHFLILSC